MKIKKYKPVTPSHRQRVSITSSDITKKRPEKSLSKGMKKTGGRGAKGRISMRRKGGGHRKLYRFIDFKRNKFDVSGEVLSIEYDPNRNVRIALIQYTDGEKRYILQPENLKVGMNVIASKNKINPILGNALLLRDIPTGTMVHNIELRPGQGGKLVRSAGLSAQIMGKEEKYCSLKFPSGEIRKIQTSCLATVGILSNAEYSNINLGKAGRSRWLGRRPKVRGVAMNPIDHPHGGGEGKTSGGRHSVTPWGKPTKGGYKTRKKRKLSDKLILQNKTKKRRKR